MDFLKVFYAPSEIEYSPKKWIYFGLVALVIILLVLFLNIHFHYGEIMNSIKERLSSMSNEEKTQALKALTRSRMLLSGVVTLILTFPLKLLFIAGIFYLILVLKGTEGFSIPLFTASVYVYIQAAGDLVKFLFSLIFKTFPFSTDLSVFIDRKGMLQGFLSVFDLFTIYAIYVASVLVSANDRKEKKIYFISLMGLLVLWGIIKGFSVKLGMK